MPYTALNGFCFTNDFCAMLATWFALNSVFQASSGALMGAAGGIPSLNFGPVVVEDLPPALILLGAVMPPPVAVHKGVVCGVAYATGANRWLAD